MFLLDRKILFYYSVQFKILSVTILELTFHLIYFNSTYNFLDNKPFWLTYEHMYSFFEHLLKLDVQSIYVVQEV